MQFKETERTIIHYHGIFLYTAFVPCGPLVGIRKVTDVALKRVGFLNIVHLAQLFVFLRDARVFSIV